MVLSGHADPAAVLGVTITFTILAVATVILRLWSRIMIVYSAGIDDVFIAAACVMTVCLTIAQGFQVRFGMGRHTDTLSQSDLATSMKPFWASIQIYGIGLFLTKISILVQYLRIFPYRLFRILCFCLIALIFAWSCVTAGLSIFFCRPVEFFWDKTIKDGKCFGEFAVWFTLASGNIVTDILVTVLPLPFFYQLQLPKRQRVALMIVFALGGLTCIISILRLQSLFVFRQTTDLSYNNPLTAIWSNLELNIGILCSCLPTLKALVSRSFPRALGSSYHRDSSRGHQRRGRANLADPESDNNKDNIGVSCGGSSHRSPTDKIPHSSSFSFDALGRGPGREPATQMTTICNDPRERSKQNERGQRRLWNRDADDDDSLEDIELSAFRNDTGNAGEQEEQLGIQVVTVVAQEVEKDYGGGRYGSSGGGGYARSEASSERELVSPSGGRRGR